MRASKTGLSLIAAYAAISLASWFYAASIRGDEEAKFLAEVLPVIPALIVIEAARLTPAISQLPNSFTIASLSVASAVVVYGVGWLVGWVGLLLFGRRRQGQ